VPFRNILCDDSEIIPLTTRTTPENFCLFVSVFVCQFSKCKLEEYMHHHRNTWNSFVQIHLPKALPENHYCCTRAPDDTLHSSEREWGLQHGQFWIRGKFNWVCTYLSVSLRFLKNYLKQAKLFCLLCSHITVNGLS